VIEKVNAGVAFVRAFEDAVVRRWFDVCVFVECDVVIVQSENSRRARVDDLL
jgi:hypothetical protein